MKRLPTLPLFLKSIAVIVMLLLSPLVKAELIEADAFEDGDNKAFTLDIARYNLLWMDASELLNLDRDDVQELLDSGLAAQGWRLPTLSEAEHIFTFMYTSRVEYDPNREFPFICLSACTNVFADTEQGQIWPTFQQIIGFEPANGEHFRHTYYTTTHGFDYFPFDIVLNAFAPGQESLLSDYPEFAYDDFTYHSFNTDHPEILRNYYDDLVFPNPDNPFSFLLVKEVPIPEPTSLLLLMMAIVAMMRFCSTTRGTR